MCRVRACAAIAVWMTAMLSMSACSIFEAIVPPIAFPPPPPAPPLPRVPAAPRAEPATPGQVYAEIFRWFSAAGYQRFQVEALAEHAQGESGFHPCIAGPGGLRYTFQWGGTRLQRLYEFAGTRNCPPLDTQLAFADKELRNEPNYACFWRSTTKSAAYAALRRGFGRGRC
jgi:hypothetical protein